jgi:squalene-associated FAD-dependent desaturase
VKRAVVVGAGWSGLACALRLADAGVQVELIEAAPHAGGRTRRLDVALGDRRYALDNGQHLLIGAYVETLAVMRRVGVAESDAFVRLPLALRYADGFRLQAAAALPAPLHLGVALVTASGLTWRERLAMLRWTRRQRASAWDVPRDVAAAELFAGEPRALVDRIWEPLCIAALNASLADASARVFLAVLRDSLGAGARASDLLVPRRDLSTLFPDAACRELGRRGAVRLRTVAQSLATEGGGTRWRVALRDDRVDADAVLLCLPPDRAAALLATAGKPQLDAATARLSSLEFAPVVTVYLRYPPGTRLAAPLHAMVADAGRQRYGQWIFDRGATDAACDGVMGVVISARGPHVDLDRDELGAAIAAQLSAQLGLGEPLGTYVITEKRAAVLPRPGLTRPAVRLPAAGLYLAGDAADSPYPSTIEGSVRTGLAAADACIDDLRVPVTA